MTRKNAVTEFLNAITDSIHKVYYAGDIDIAGVNMLYGSINCNEITIEPFMPLYRSMISVADVNKMNRTEDNRDTSYNIKLSGL